MFSFFKYGLGCLLGCWFSDNPCQLESSFCKDASLFNMVSIGLTFRAEVIQKRFTYDNNRQIDDGQNVITTALIRIHLTEIKPT